MRATALAVMLAGYGIETAIRGKKAEANWFTLGIATAFLVCLFFGI